MFVQEKEWLGYTGRLFHALFLKGIGEPQQWIVIAGLALAAAALSWASWRWYSVRKNLWIPAVPAVLILGAMGVRLAFVVTESGAFTAENLKVWAVLGLGYGLTTGMVLALMAVVFRSIHQSQLKKKILSKPRDVERMDVLIPEGDKIYRSFVLFGKNSGRWSGRWKDVTDMSKEVREVLKKAKVPVHFVKADLENAVKSH